MVEAAGVEPASEKAHRKKNYMLSRVPFDSPGPIRTDKNQTRLAR